MSDKTKKFREEEEIGKTYDLRVTRRLLRYLKPYWFFAAVALVFTFLTNILISLQPRFTQSAVDDYITPKQTEGLWIFSLLFSFSIWLLRLN